MNMLLRAYRQSPLDPTRRAIPGVAALIGLALLVGCTSVPERPAEGSASVPWPDFAPTEAGEAVYRVVPESSHLRIRVDPEGPMARLGHSHVIGGNAVTGIVVLGSGAGSARLDLEIDAASLDVDRPEWRSAAGLEPELDADAISGTRSNMRGERVLDVAGHPKIPVRSVGVAGPAWLPDVTARIRLRGKVREVTVPVAVERTDERLIASGALELLQSDFGIEPFSAAGGALRVSDRMRIRFRIVAERESGNP